MTELALMEELTLDISSALSDIDRLRSEIEELRTPIDIELDSGGAEAEVLTIRDAVEDLSTPIDIELDGAGAEAEVSLIRDAVVAIADMELTPIVVTEPAEASIGEIGSRVEALELEMQTLTFDLGADAAIAQIEALEAEISILGDQMASLGTEGATGMAPATQALEETSTAAKGVTQNFDYLSAGVAAVTVPTAAMTRGVGVALRTFGPYGIAVGAAAGLTKLFVNAANEAEVAERRMTTAFGPLTRSVEHLDIGGLNENLGDFAIRIGASDDGLRLAAARMGELGRASGASAPLVAQTSEELLVLAGYLATTNPSLGTAEQVADRLGMTLARGGPRAAQLGLDLNSVAIQAKAAEIALADGRTEVTNFDLQAAGLALSMQQVGGSLATDIAEGAKQGVIQLRSVRTEIDETIEAAGKEIKPVVMEALVDLAPLAVVGVKVIGETLAALAPIFQLVGIAAKPFIFILEKIASLPEVKFPGVDFFRGITDLDKGAAFMGKGIDEAATATGSYDEALRSADSAVRDMDVAQQRLMGVQRELPKAFDYTAQAIDAAKTRMEEFSSSVNVESVSVSDAIEAMQKDTALGLGDFEKNLRDQMVASQRFWQNVNLIQSEGLATLATTLAEMGPTKGASLAQQLADETPEVRREMAHLMNAANQEQERGQKNALAITETNDLEFQRALTTLHARIALKVGTDWPDMWAAPVAEGAQNAVVAAEVGMAPVGPVVIASMESGLAPLPGVMNDTVTSAVGDIDVGPEGRLIGANFGEAIASGLEAQGGRVAAAARAIANALPTIVTDILGITSPSTVAMEIGEEFSIGMAIGISDASPQVQHAVNLMAREVVAEADETMSEEARRLSNEIAFVFETQLNREQQIAALTIALEAEQRFTDRWTQLHRQRQRLIEEETRDRQRAADEATRAITRAEEEATRAAESAARERTRIAEEEAREQERIREAARERRRAREEAERSLEAEMTRNREEFRFDAMTRQQQIARLDFQLRHEREYTDRWVELVRLRERLIQEEADAVAEAAAEEADLNERRTRAMAEYEEGILDIQRRVAEEEARIFADRADQLTGFASITERFVGEAGVSVQRMLRNAREQNQVLAEFSAGLGELRARGVSETLIEAAGVTGPEDIRQLRQLLKASPEDIRALEAELATRTQLVSAQTTIDVAPRLAVLEAEATVEMEALKAVLDTELAEINGAVLDMGHTIGQNLARAIGEGFASEIGVATNAAALMRANIEDVLSANPSWIVEAVSAHLGELARR